MAVGLASNGVPQFGSKSHPGEGLSEFIEEENCVHPTFAAPEESLCILIAQRFISVIQGGIVRGLCIHLRRLLGGR